ncbi:phosphotyrosine protein phosphatase [Streptomyces sp. NPDC008343]|uniref:arsenate reductase/protein-tyrosine-phosphatase family protein n=1 Tax=Streptomyces sp. NPDC008343 TaxID=3364828 RepID=UPI0036E76453
MAMGFFQHIAGDDSAVAWSGGSEPGFEVHPAAVAAMSERGIDISREFAKPRTDEIVRAPDVVVSRGCGDACRVFPARRARPRLDPGRSRGQDRRRCPAAVRRRNGA